MDKHLNVSLPLIENNPEQDIEAMLLESTKNKYLKMISDKVETPSLLIPKNFEQFLRTKLFYNFLASIYTYITQYHRIHDKYKKMEIKMSMRTGKKKHQPLEFQKVRLQTLEKQISSFYGTILLKHSNRVVNADQLFFESLLYLVSKVIKDFFKADDFLVLEEEINRLFRTEKYNIIQKRHENDQMLKRYPILKDSLSAKMTIDSHINKIMRKKHIMFTIRNQKREKQFDNRSRSLNKQELMDAQQRSPIVSVWLASNKRKLNQFVSDNHCMGKSRRSINKKDMEELIKDSILDKE